METLILLFTSVFNHSDHNCGDKQRKHRSIPHYGGINKSTASVLYTFHHCKLKGHWIQVTMTIPQFAFFTVISFSI